MAHERRSVPHRWVLLGGTVIAILALDQLSKAWAVRELAYPPEGNGRVIDLIGSLRFRYAENTGMAFSKGAESGRWIALVVILIVAALLYLTTKAYNRVQVVLLGVVIGGALGNLLDRAFRAEDGLFSGAVVDFIDVQWWPVFNVADAAVVCGGIALVWFGTREPDEEPDGSGREPDGPVSGQVEPHGQVDSPDPEVPPPAEAHREGDPG